MYWKQRESTDDVVLAQIHDGNGLIKRRNLFGDSSKLPLKFEIWELEPGVSEGNHTHPSSKPLEEIYYFLEGEGKMTFETEDVDVNAGDAIMVPPGILHGIYNPGSKPLKFAIIWGKPTETCT